MTGQLKYGNATLSELPTLLGWAFLYCFVTGDTVWKSCDCVVFFRIDTNRNSRVTDSRRRRRREKRFHRECRQAISKRTRCRSLSWPWNKLYREIVKGVASDPHKGGGPITYYYSAILNFCPPDDWF